MLVVAEMPRVERPCGENADEKDSAEMLKAGVLFIAAPKKKGKKNNPTKKGTQQKNRYRMQSAGSRDHTKGAVNRACDGKKKRKKEKQKETKRCKKKQKSRSISLDKQEKNKRGFSLKRQTQERGEEKTHWETNLGENIMFAISQFM